MIKIRDATTEDLDYCRENPINEAVTKDFANTPIAGWAKTAELDGKVLGVGGVVVYWEGVGEGWYCLSKNAENNKVSMARFIHSVIHKAMVELKLHRLQTTIRVDFIHAKRLIEAAGFEYEGLMRKYTQDKKDAYLYSLTRD